MIVSFLFSLWSYGLSGHGVNELEEGGIIVYLGLILFESFHLSGLFHTRQGDQPTDWLYEKCPETRVDKLFLKDPSNLLQDEPFHFAHIL